MPPKTVSYELLEFIPNKRGDVLNKIEKYLSFDVGIRSMMTNIKTPELSIPIDKLSLQDLRRYAALLREEYMDTKRWYYLNTNYEEDWETSDELSDELSD